MAGDSGFITPPPIRFDQPARPTRSWRGDADWADTSLSLDDTKPGDSSVNVTLTRGTRTVRMPLDATQVGELVAELSFRAGLLYPNGAAR